jgi:hypothetical protein
MNPPKFHGIHLPGRDLLDEIYAQFIPWKCYVSMTYISTKKEEI